MNIIRVGKLSINISFDIITFGISFGLPDPENSEWYIHFAFILISWGG